MKPCLLSVLLVITGLDLTVAFGLPTASADLQRPLRRLTATLASEAVDSHPPGPFLSPPFAETEYDPYFKSLEERILYPDDMDTVHDPLWPKLRHVGEDQNYPHLPTPRRGVAIRQSSSNDPGRRLRLLGMQSTPDPLWPELDQL